MEVNTIQVDSQVKYKVSTEIKKVNPVELLLETRKDLKYSSS